MQKTLLIAGTLLLAAVSATPVLAQGRSYYGRGYNNGGPNSYMQYFGQLREEQRHDRLHRQLDRAHVGEHYQGLDSRGDHRDLHGALEETHDAYHYDQRGVGGYGGYGGNGYGNSGGYGGYGYGYGNAPGYGYGGNYGGLSFGFGFGR